jgi:hypothetical protein
MGDLVVNDKPKPRGEEVNDDKLVTCNGCLEVLEIVERGDVGHGGAVL